MSERFFVETAVTGTRAELIGTEAHHALNVMRLREGDLVTLFDGTGAEFAARVIATGRSTVELEIEDRRQIDRELRCELVLGVALPKGDRQKWLIEKATELGVTRLCPLITERGVAQPGKAALARLHRTVVEASKQCGRNRLLELLPPRTLSDFLSAAPTSAIRLLAHPGEDSDSHFDGHSPETALRAIAEAPSPTGPPPAYWAAVGPEGGFTDDEAATALQAGWQCVSLGPRILRVETAALALAARLAALSDS